MVEFCTKPKIPQNLVAHLIYADYLNGHMVNDEISRSVTNTNIVYTGCPTIGDMKVKLHNFLIFQVLRTVLWST